ncbi:hypothetical protein [Maribellus mangrovi]|uniref:hypothetical protein n=1 Tax=Maribellus mangrovi TaxID=3133146 RepID=UPI0030EF7DE2
MNIKEQIQEIKQDPVVKTLCIIAAIIGTMILLMSLDEQFNLFGQGIGSPIYKLFH